MTIVSFHEQVNGWAAYLNRKRSSVDVVRGYQKFELLLLNFSCAQILPFGVNSAEVFNDLVSQKIRVGTMDMRIASIAIANQMTLLTRNAIDFERIPSLVFDDWLSNPTG